MIIDKNKKIWEIDEMTEEEQLLNYVADIRKRYEAKWQRTGEKYNLFNVAGIAHKEVYICRVLADMLNPHGKHGQGSRYLSEFCGIISNISEKLSFLREFKCENTKVTPEFVIDKNRRIDITIENDNIFVPIEVKIGAPDLPKQLADYYEESKKRNEIKKNDIVPVLYLTVDGHEPSDFSKGGIGKDSYVKLTFKDDILAWLESCERGNTPETKVPVRENLRQLIAAIKSFCGISEDTKMGNEIFEQITKEEKFVRAALDIRRNMDFDNKALKEFEGPIMANVQKVFPDAKYIPRVGGWYCINITLKSGAYILELNYDWKSVQIKRSSLKNDEEHDKQIEKCMEQIMTDWTQDSNKGAPNFVFALWETNRYPFNEPVEEELYYYRLWKIYSEHPDEVAEKIINIVRALESV